jgi:hypothetical protein
VIQKRVVGSKMIVQAIEQEDLKVIVVDGLGMVRWVLML